LTKQKTAVKVDAVSQEESDTLLIGGFGAVFAITCGLMYMNTYSAGRGAIFLFFTAGFGSVVAYSAYVLRKHGWG